MVASEHVCLIKIDTDKQAHGNGEYFLYSRGHEISKKLESGKSSDRLGSLAYAQEVKTLSAN